MSNKILFVFEGERTELQIISSLQKFFANENTTVKCVYGAEIYQIYKEIVKDNDLDTFNLIKERNIKINKTLNDYNRDDFAEIYLFFDYDGHSSLAKDSSLKELLGFFNEETDKGKLYVSYPMVEALKHICKYETFMDLNVRFDEIINYKKIVDESGIPELCHFRDYNLNTWKLLINFHLKKMNYIVNDSFTLPDRLISQLMIFSQQLEKYINTNSIVAVLSAFPIFIHDYYGNDEIKKRIK